MAARPKKPSIELGENHRRSISISLQLLDKALSKWEQWISAPIPPGVMYQQRDTLSTGKKKELQTRIANLREIMLRLRDDLDLAAVRPSTSQLIIGESTVLWEMFAELNSTSLQGYGTVSPQLAAYIDPIGRTLSDQINEISRLFSKPTTVNET